MDNKLEENLCLQQIILMFNLITSFISSNLDLVLKYDKSFQQIYHLSHPKGKWVDDHIPDKEGKIRYAKF